MRQVCYYTCTLVPPGLLEQAGYVPRALLDSCRDTAAPETDTGFKPSILPHANTCPYVVNTLAEAERTLAEDPGAVLVVPSGCDAMRRAGDTLSALEPDRVYAYTVPRGDDPGSVSALARELDRLMDWLACSRSGPAEAVGGGPEPRTEACVSGSFGYPKPPRPGGVFIVGGPMSGPGLLEVVDTLKVPVSGAETCRGPDCAERLSRIGSGGWDSGAVATELLAEATCPRSSVVARSTYLRRRLEETEAVAIIYGRLPFCDPGVYDAEAVRAIAEELGLPFLEVEIDHPLDVDGRLLVRIEAFAETLTLSDSPLGDDDLFDDVPLEDPGVPDTATDAPSDAAGRSAAKDPNGNGAARLLAGGFARRALAARTRVAAFRSGTARRYLEHYALDAALELYKPEAFVPWVSYLFPPEILAAYSLTPLIPEVAATTLAGTDFADELEQAMNRQRLARDVCSYHRAAKAALTAGLLPAPSVCLGTTPLCLGKECMLDAIASEHSVLYRSIRVPLPPDEGPAPAGDVDDVATQLRAVHALLGEMTGRRSRLDRAVAYSNRASTVWSDMCDRRLSGEFVLDGRRAFAFTFLGQVVWGSEDGAKGFERLRTVRGRSDLELQAAPMHVGRGDTSHSTGNGAPSPRILWLHTMPHQDPTLFDLIRSAGGAVVFEEMGRVHLDPLDPRDPFAGMARRLIEHPLWGTGVRRARNVIDLVDRGGIDAVIHFNHWGCRHGLGTLPILRSELRAAGIPFLALDGDALDRPGLGVESSARQLESFLEML